MTEPVGVLTVNQFARSFIAFMFAYRGGLVLPTRQSTAMVSTELPRYTLQIYIKSHARIHRSLSSYGSPVGHAVLTRARASPRVPVRARACVSLRMCIYVGIHMSSE